MSKSKPQAKKEAVQKEAPGFYKGYDIRWLRNEPEHADFHLVAEYDASQAEKDEEE